MIHPIPDVLSPQEARELRQRLEQARWIDGKKTAGISAAPTKTNQELDQADPAFPGIAQTVLNALAKSRAFASRSLPLSTSTP
ncbi:MAG TPA: PKHD-type hydroxylase, partial [bacterium]|nr:PKHD-type hydroxylase [bacterium]